jgi:SAM-dependent methyltransferase
MTAFDPVAAQYRALWSDAPSGRYQREAAWREIDPLFGPGSRVLDLGCGTGDDAVHLAARGVDVFGIDESLEMVRIARAGGVSAYVLAIEELAALEGPFDGAISNFGALNCVRQLRPVARELGRLVTPGGYVALGLIGKFCLWETAWYLRSLELRKAFRRLRAECTAQSLGLRVYCPGTRKLVRAFSPDFRLVRWAGLGLAVPPSYVKLPETVVRRLAGIDGRLAHRRLWRAMADHRLYIFQRV